MDLRDLDKEFETIPVKHKAIIANFMRELDMRFDFENNDQVMEHLFRLIDILMRKLVDEKNPLKKLKMVDFMIYQIIYKTGVLVGLTEKTVKKIEVDHLNQLVGKN